MSIDAIARDRGLPTAEVFYAATLADGAGMLPYCVRNRINGSRLPVELAA